jgi:hypothetical protein
MHGHSIPEKVYSCFADWENNLLTRMGHNNLPNYTCHWLVIPALIVPGSTTGVGPAFVGDFKL